MHTSESSGTYTRENTHQPKYASLRETENKVDGWINSSVHTSTNLEMLNQQLSAAVEEQNRGGCTKEGRDNTPGQAASSGRDQLFTTRGRSYLFTFQKVTFQKWLPIFPLERK